MKTAVILFNLGGPSSLEEVEPFLFSLFYDPSIIKLPNPFRWFLAKLISKRRVHEAKKIYQQLGGKSPILENTEKQRSSLEKALRQKGHDISIYIAMRHASPRLKDLALDGFDQFILLPLYPQYSTTTTASAFKEWDILMQGKQVHVKKVCCYPQGGGFIKAQTQLILDHIKDLENFRILFSAHGLPSRIIKGGDPYVYQVGKTAEAILKELALSLGKIDHQICYQSRVGPVEWVGPSTDAEIIRAGKDGKNVVLVPLSFVNEHSETLVELDIEYKNLAQKEGVNSYIRIPTVSDHSLFIDFLVDEIEEKLYSDSIISCGKDSGFCPKLFRECPCN